MPVGFTQSITCLHTHAMQYKESYKRNQQWKGDCYSRTVVVGCSVPSEVPAVCCPYFGCCSAEKPKHFLVVWVPLPSLPYMLLHSNSQTWNCFFWGESGCGGVVYYFFLISGDLFASYFSPFKNLLNTWHFCFLSRKARRNISCIYFMSENILKFFCWLLFHSFRVHSMCP